jgi:uncharacterized protein YbjT (DUF2867 family)
LVADLRDPATFEPRLKGVDGFFIVTDPFSARAETDEWDSPGWVKDEFRQGEGALRAAHEAKVPHVVLASVTVAALEQGLRFHESKIPIEKEARKLGLACTILRPPFFMEGWFWSALDKSLVRWETGRLEWRVKANTPIPHIATDDIGRAAAWSFDHPDQSVGQAWELVGEVTTFPAIAKTLTRKWGRPIVFSEVLNAKDDFPVNPAFVRRDYTWGVGQWKAKFGFRMTTFDEFVDRLAITL